MSSEQLLPKTGWKRDIVRILLCFISGLITAVNLRTFVHTGGLIPGGFNGVTILLQHIFSKFWDISLPYGPIYLLFNVPVIILSYFKLGKKFTLFSMVSVLTVAFVTDLIPAYIITRDVLLISVFGGIIGGLAASICLFAGATGGGTDFISIFITEKTGIDGWNVILAFNALLLLLDGILIDWDSALYSIIFQFASTVVIQNSYKRYQKNTLFVVTNKPKEVAEVIDRVTMHGATEIDAKGMYEGEERSMIYSVVSSDESKLVMKEIKKVDPNAFVNAMKTDQLSGRFFLRPKD